MRLNKVDSGEDICKEIVFVFEKLYLYLYLIIFKASYLYLLLHLKNSTSSYLYFVFDQVYLSLSLVKSKVLYFKNIKFTIDQQKIEADVSGH